MGSEYRVAYPTHTKEHCKARSGNVTKLWGLHLPRKACVTKENEQKDFVPKDILLHCNEINLVFSETGDQTSIAIQK